MAKNEINLYECASVRRSSRIHERNQKDSAVLREYVTCCVIRKDLYMPRRIDLKMHNLRPLSELPFVPVSIVLKCKHENTFLALISGCISKFYSACKHSD